MHVCIGRKVRINTHEGEICLHIYTDNGYPKRLLNKTVLRYLENVLFCFSKIYVVNIQDNFDYMNIYNIDFIYYTICFLSLQTILPYQL